MYALCTFIPYPLSPLTQCTAMQCSICPVKRPHPRPNRPYSRDHNCQNQCLQQNISPNPKVPDTHPSINTRLTSTPSPIASPWSTEMRQASFSACPSLAIPAVFFHLRRLLRNRQGSSKACDRSRPLMVPPLHVLFLQLTLQAPLVRLRVPSLLRRYPSPRVTNSSAGAHGFADVSGCDCPLSRAPGVPLRWLV